MRRAEGEGIRVDNAKILLVCDRREQREYMDEYGLEIKWVAVGTFICTNMFERVRKWWGERRQRKAFDNKKQIEGNQQMKMMVENTERFGLAEEYAEEEPRASKQMILESLDGALVSPANLKKEASLTKFHSKQIQHYYVPRETKLMENQVVWLHKNKVIKYIKSELWEERVGTDFIYMNYNPRDPILMLYRLSRIQEANYSSALDYFLRTSSNRRVSLVGKDGMLRPKLGSLLKHSKRIMCVVVGASSLPHQFHYSANNIIALSNVGSQSWGWAEELVVLTQRLHSFAAIWEYLVQVSASLTWEEFRKTSFIMPNFLTIDQISLLIFPIIRRLAGDVLFQEVYTNLSFELELIDTNNSDSVIIVRCNLRKQKSIETQYCLTKMCVGFFKRDFSYGTANSFDQFSSEMLKHPLSRLFYYWDKYMLCKVRFRSQHKEMLSVLKEDDYFAIENNLDIETQECQYEGFVYRCKPQFRKLVGQVYKSLYNTRLPLRISKC